MLERVGLILAQDDDDIAKIIFGVIAALIWAISAFVSWANKKSQEAKRRAQEEMIRRAEQSPPPMHPSRRRIAEGLATHYPDVLLPPAPPPQRQRVRQGPLPPIPQHRPLPPPSKPKRRQKPAKPVQIAPPLPQVRREEVLEQVQLLDESPLLRPAGPPVAAELSRMLTPTTLRSQFVLLEVLQPPLALREQRH